MPVVQAVICLFDLLNCLFSTQLFEASDEILDMDEDSLKHFLNANCVGAIVVVPNQAV